MGKKSQNSDDSPDKKVPRKTKSVEKPSKKEKKPHQNEFNAIFREVEGKVCDPFDGGNENY